MADSEDISISRLYPRSKRRTDQVAGWAAFSVVAILALLHVVAVQFHSLHSAVVAILPVFTSFWLLLAVFGLGETVKGIRKARLGPLAQISESVGLSSRERLITALVAIAAGAAASYALVVVLRSQVEDGRWLTLFAGSTYCLAIVGIAIELLDRHFGESSRKAYSSLERDILLEGLDSDSIKERFIDELLGKPVADWLRQQQRDLEVREDEIFSKLELIRDIVKSTRSPELPDTKERFRKELEEVNSRTQQYLRTASSLLHQIANYKRGRVLPKDEKSLLEVITQERKAAETRMEAVLKETHESIAKRIGPSFDLKADKDSID